MKKLFKDVKGLAITGVGIGVLGSVTKETGGGEALSPISKGLGVVGGIAMAGHGMRFIEKIMPKKRKNKLF